MNDAGMHSRRINPIWIFARLIFLLLLVDGFMTARRALAETPAPSLKVTTISNDDCSAGEVPVGTNDTAYSRPVGSDAAKTRQLVEDNALFKTSIDIPSDESKQQCTSEQASPRPETKSLTTSACAKASSSRCLDGITSSEKGQK